MLIAEFIIGRGSGLEAVSAYKKIAPKSLWSWIGRLGVLGSFLLLSFYSVVGGWVIIYTGKAVSKQIIGKKFDFYEIFSSIVCCSFINIFMLYFYKLINFLLWYFMFIFLYICNN